MMARAPVYAKRCSSCGTFKQAKAFYPRPNVRSGLSARCRPCERQRVRERNRALLTAHPNIREQRRTYMRCYMKGYMRRRRMNLPPYELCKPPCHSFAEVATASGHDVELLLPLVAAFLLTEFHCSADAVCDLLEGSYGGHLANGLARGVSPASATSDAIMAYLEEQVARRSFRRRLEKALHEVVTQNETAG